MTPEAQRIAIAEVCGWKRAPDFLGWEDPRVWTRNGKDRAFAEQLPDYLTDLNQIKKAMDTLGADEPCRFGEILVKMVLRGKPINGFSWFDISNATAAQRAEAFLRTIGKWE